jgi:cation diffusion facilitator CzcD-associated flavoprotein CzcO
VAVEVRKPLRTVIIGAGMAGVASAIKLRESGHHDLTIYEKGDSVGGTWRENTYPGIACDVPAHLYTYSFAPNPEWSHMFAPGPEIRDYLERVALDHGLDRAIVFGAEVSTLEWVGGRWHLGLADGSSDVADVVIAATGVLHHPAHPDIEGLDDFDGSAFHSARWDHSVTIDGARVGVVGTGSSAVQIVSAIAERVGRLDLFQRTPQWIMPLPNAEATEEEKARYRDDPELLAARRVELSSSFVERFADAVVDADSPVAKLMEDVCRANLETTIVDPELRERLRPDYRAACKRLVVSPDFYSAIQRPNARLVTEPIERIERRGVRTADGSLHELDVIVLATGFRVDRFLRPIDVTGRGGVRLEDRWAKRPSAYLSVSIPEFPNLFLINGPNGPVGNFSLIDVAEMQIDYILQLMRLLGDGSCAEVSATASAAERVEADRVEAAKRTIWMTGCRSWYLDDRGVPAAWPWRMEHFREVMAAPDLRDFDLAPPVG